MATASINRDDRSSLSRELFPVRLRIYYPPLTPPSSFVPTPSVNTRQPFENGIKLRTTITTVSALLDYLQHHDDPPCMAPLDVSEYLDPNSLHVVWKSELELKDTPLNDENIRTQMANVWLHGGGDTLVVAAKKREVSQEGAGAERGNNKRQQAEFNDQDKYTHQVPSTLATDAPDFRSSSSAAATAASSRHDETAGMEDVGFTDPSSRPSESGSLYNPVQSEMRTRGGALPTNTAPISPSSHTGSDTFDIPAARSDPKYSRFTREPDSGNNETWGASTPSSGRRGGQQGRSDPRPPGFWKPEGGWDSEAAARAGGPAATSSDFSFGPSRPAGDRTAGSGAQYRPVRPPSPPPKQHVWSDDTLGDRPKDILLPAVPVKRSIFSPDRGAKPLSESRWATEEDRVGFGRGIQTRGVQGQSSSSQNQNRAQGGNRSWGSSLQQPSRNWDPLPQQGSWDPTPTPNRSQFQNWDSARQENQQWNPQGQTQGQTQSQNQGQGQGHGQGQGQDGGEVGDEGQWDSGEVDLNGGRWGSKKTRKW
ncbi:hypothetical protein MMC29_007011 [Sticta canariensis]|nr:hypothetical protein [Sticta canariensis]